MFYSRLNVLTVLVSIIVVSSLWQYELLTFVILCLFFVTTLLLGNPSYRVIALKLFVVGFILGPMAEMVSILTGAWIYAIPNILGMVPMWLFPLWGNAAVFLGTLALDLSKKPTRI